jgi:heme/copper-type cytochrome/quinol oxidase subunit 2
VRTRGTYGFLIAAAALAVAFVPLPSLWPPAAPAARTFKIEASQFSYSPAEVQVDPGDTVTFQLVSTDVVHGLYMDEYGASVEADPGQTASMTFVANRPGSFRFRCNVTCGAMHPFMIGRLTVGRNTTFYRGIALALIGIVGVVLFRKPHTPGGTTS